MHKQSVPGHFFVGWLQASGCVGQSAEEGKNAPYIKWPMPTQSETLVCGAEQYGDDIASTVSLATVGREGGREGGKEGELMSEA